MKRLYIVDDLTTVRQMLADILERHNYEIIGESGNGQDALKEILELQPDVVVVDARLPGLNGLELIRRLNRQLPHTRYLVFSAYQNPSIVKDMLEAGAHGFVEKTAHLREFINGLGIIAEGGTFFGPNVAELIRSVVANPNSVQRSKDSLTEREREVLQMIAEGHSTKEIAQKLGLSVKTVDNHRTNMMRKLDLHNVASITRYAMQNGLIELDPAI
ncbi:response regulator transcription factor [Pelagicoccus sp. SDUM812003]|uniref:response regulator transcription factor n=1 Tax=Pelagicoccus sp. SDUM812003 TaxID=3041267 RepID=UPI00280D13C2|nr:response regulator transcription factor [Pelagicoccus sp. SDUM812003]MDQ8204903.1 response regulator transcription factor [Pelagicoccus sp. SDUM812003]